MIYVILPMISLFFLPSHSQSNQYAEGHVVTISGEVIEGQLKKMSDEKSARKINMINADGEKLKFKSNEIQSYVRGDQAYVSKRFNRANVVVDQPRFMLVLSDGDLKLFKENYVEKSLMRKKNGKTSRPSFIAPANDFYLEKDGTYGIVSKSDFKKSVLPFVEDNEELVMALLKGDYNYSDLEEIVSSYNSRVNLQSLKLEKGLNTNN